VCISSICNYMLDIFNITNLIVLQFTIKINSYLYKDIHKYRSILTLFLKMKNSIK